MSLLSLPRGQPFIERATEMRNSGLAYPVQHSYAGVVEDSMLFLLPQTITGQLSQLGFLWLRQSTMNESNLRKKGLISAHSFSTPQSLIKGSQGRNWRQEPSGMD